MSYNKAKAVNEWLEWKEQEEQKLRALGVDEDTIQRLHTYDWTEFNRERQYKQRLVEWSLDVEQCTASEIELPVKNSDQLLDSIENPELLRVLSGTDRLTLEAVLMNMAGFSTEEICQKLNISTYAYYNRIKRLKKKIKNIF